MVPPSRSNIAYLYGIRGIVSLYIVLFHLNYIILDANKGIAEPLYHRFTDWMRYGDFRVGAFFVISGYLMALPLVERGTWRLPHGVRGFLERRAERLLMPYYIALAVSVVLFVLWANMVGHSPGMRGLLAGITMHLLMIHNLREQTVLYLNDTLWNIALEFQCYLLFAFLFVPLVRRFRIVGLGLQLAIAVAIGLMPHYFMHGYLDWTRPWFIILFSMGIIACVLGSRAETSWKWKVHAVPWGLLAVSFTSLTVLLIALSPIDTSYADGMLQNITLGAAVSALLVYTSLGMPGKMVRMVAPFIRLCENAKLCAVGRFSYSTYLIHYPILRILIALVEKVTHSALAQGVLALFVFFPLTLLLAYGFHIVIERPCLEGRYRLFPRATQALTKEGAALS